MKYIRTKDGIYEKNKLIYAFNDNEEYLIKDIIKQADTIEELCDEFIVVSKDDKHDIYKSITIGIKTLVVNKAYLIALYGAIWTDKGLIYVAKLNDKGELELL